MAGAKADRLRAPGRSLGVALVDPVRHRPGPGRRRHRDRARRARHGRRRAGRLPRRHGRPHHGRRPGTSPSFTLAELRELDFSFWFIPGADVTPGPPRRPSIPTGVGRPRILGSGSPPLREVLEQFPGVVLNLDIKQTAPVVAPYEESLAQAVGRVRAHRRRHCGLVPRRRPPTPSGHSRPRCRRRREPSATAEFWRAVQTGSAIPDTPAVALPGARAHGRSRRGRRGVRGGGPPQRQGGPRMDGQRCRRPWSGWWDSGSTGSSPICRRTLAQVLGRPDVAWDGRWAERRRGRSGG